MNDRSITLIGAGLVGPLLAVFLARRGFAVTLYERRPDPRKAVLSDGRSINLGLHRAQYPKFHDASAPDASSLATPIAARSNRRRLPNELSPYQPPAPGWHWR